MTRSARSVLRAAALLPIFGAIAAGAAPREDPQLIDMKSGMDSTVRPGDDFYGYANGGWLKVTTLPAGKSEYGTSDVLRERNQRRVAEIVQHAAAPTATRSNLEQLVGDFYASLTDLKRIDARGLAPLSDELVQIGSISDRTALAAYLGHVTQLGDGTGAPAESIFAVWIHQGFSEADHNLAHLQQGGLGLSGRDDYLDQTPDKIDLRAKYRALVASVLHRIGNAEPDAQAGQILALETAIARAHATQADTDDVFKDNNVWLRSDFQTRAPGIDWTTYFAAAGLDAQREFVVWQPSAVVGISRLVASEPLDVWKAYLVFHLLKHYAPELPADIRDLFVAFNGQSATEPISPTRAHWRSRKISSAK